MPRFKLHSGFKAAAAITLIASFTGFASADAARPTGHHPRRIVSLNLCADQYLLALADRSQIAGLTSNATSTDLSAAAAQTAGLHIMGKSAEEVLMIAPDLIVGAPARRSGFMAALSGQNYRAIELKPAHNYADIVTQIRALAVAVDQVPRGEALIARMDRELARLPRQSGSRVAAYYQRRGFLTGTGTLIDDLMARAGLVNLASKLGKPVLTRLSLEELIAAQPDYLIVDSNADHRTDQGSEMLHHPVLDAIPRLRIPQSWTVCGGPAYVLAARSLAQQLRRKESERINAR